MSRRLVAALALVAFASALVASLAVPAWSGGIERVPGILSARPRPGEAAPWCGGARLARVLWPLLALSPEHLPQPARPEVAGRAGAVPDPAPRLAPPRRPATPRSPPAA